MYEQFVPKKCKELIREYGPIVRSIGTHSTLSFQVVCGSA